MKLPEWLQNIKLIEKRGEAELNLISIDRVYEDGGVDLTLNSYSFINFLPLLYHEKDFLKRYLFGIQSSSIEINRTIFNISEEFESQNSRHIDWLSSWFGIEYGNIIDEKAKRKIVSNVIELYKTRGTKSYFKKLIKSLVDVDIEIDDNKFSSSNRDNSTKKLRAFTVIIDKKISDDREEEARVYSIIKNVFDREKPVNTKMHIKYSYEIEQKEKDNYGDEKIFSFTKESIDDSYDY